MFILAAKEGHCVSWPRKQGGWLCFIITFSVFSFIFLLLCYFLSGVPKWSKSEEWSHKWSDFEIAVAVSRAHVLLNFGSEGLWQYFSQVCVCVCVCVCVYVCVACSNTSRLEFGVCHCLKQPLGSVPLSLDRLYHTRVHSRVLMYTGAAHQGPLISTSNFNFALPMPFANCGQNLLPGLSTVCTRWSGF